MPVAGMEPTEVDSFGYSGPVGLNPDLSPMLTNANGQYVDSPVGAVNQFTFSVSFQQNQSINYQGESYPMGTGPVTWNVNVSPSGATNISGTNGVNVNYRP
jgi:hypothetical protein